MNQSESADFKWDQHESWVSPGRCSGLAAVRNAPLGRRLRQPSFALSELCCLGPRAAAAATLQTRSEPHCRRYHTLGSDTGENIAEHPGLTMIAAQREGEHPPKSL